MRIHNQIFEAQKNDISAKTVGQTFTEEDKQLYLQSDPGRELKKLQALRVRVHVCM
jgi:hypothetical protein